MRSPCQWRQSKTFSGDIFHASRSKRKKRAGPIDRFPLHVSRWRRRRRLIIAEVRGERSCARVREPVLRHPFLVIIIITARLCASQTDGLSPFFPSQSTKYIRYIASTPRHNHLDVRLFFYLFTIIPSVQRVSNLCSCTHAHTHNPKL